MSSRSKVAVIGGGGNVGAAVAFSIIACGIHADVIIVDAAEKLAEGQALDIADASHLSPANCCVGTFKEAGDCDVIIITAGARQQPGEPRSKLLNRNYSIMKSIIDNIKPIKETAVFIVVSNPVDVLASVIQRLTKLPYNQVMGSGTFLDSARLRNNLSEKLKISSSSIHAYILGEHGDDQFVGWSSATVAGTPLLSYDAIKDLDLNEIEKDISRKAYEIIEAKGSTYYGIGLHVAYLTRAVLGDERKVIPVSTFIKQYDAYMSIPSIVGAKGAEPVEINLDDQEKEHLQHAAIKIKGMCDQLNYN
ncbi:hypothetical protein BB561_002072 [Smittium simulii]|uniref:L-lactate dehydrogenase n=1 Tax=Smittium simulii TaxID=133385 RepID=A0A2T9YRY7_9FUNG|nr:hypothetical protein BB561_002072 [Smittium simulii]